MSDAVLYDFIGQLDSFSFKQRLSILDAVIHSLGKRKTKVQGKSKSELLYGFIKDSNISLESAREERLAKI